MVLLKTAIFTILVPGTVTVLLPYVLLSADFAEHRCNIGLIHLVGFVLLLLGIGVYVWCAWDFSIIGKGTPAPIDPPKVLVQRGLYRFSRNPMYVGVLLILAGEAVLFRSPFLAAYAALFWLFFHLAVIGYEEPVLRRTFGPAYDEYKSRVPRWFPKLHR